MTAHSAVWQKNLRSVEIGFQPPRAGGDGMGVGRSGSQQVSSAGHPHIHCGSVYLRVYSMKVCTELPHSH